MILPLVSVIIPAHNGEKYILEAIKSVQAQDYPHYEICVIDSASVDNTAALVKNVIGVNYIFSSIASAAVARNLGAQCAKGEYLAFLDQDDVWVSEKLKWQIEFLQKNLEFSAVIGMQQMYLEEGAQKPHWLKTDFLHKPQVGYLPSALLVKRDVFFQHDCFDENLSLASDVDWFCRMKDLGIKIGDLPQVLVMRRIHQENMSNKIVSLQKEILFSLKESIRRERITKS